MSILDENILDKADVVVYENLRRKINDFLTHHMTVMTPYDDPWGDRRRYRFRYYGNIYSEPYIEEINGTFYIAQKNPEYPLLIRNWDGYILPEYINFMPVVQEVRIDAVNLENDAFYPASARNVLIGPNIEVIDCPNLKYQEICPLI